jgi:hypothetical protein
MAGPLTLSPVPKLQFFQQGTTTPLAGGLLFTYSSGTTTKTNTYQNVQSSGGAPNTNPIVLDSNGECVCFLDSTIQYTFTLSPPGDTDPPSNPLYSVDNVGYGGMLQSLAPITSPVFLGQPQAPTPPLGDNSASIATTQFVQETIQTGLNNAALTGTPTAPTAPPGTLTTQIATTAFVGAEITKAPASQWFNTSTSFTVPAGVTLLHARGWSGGGGGGCSTVSQAGAGGGGSGAYGEAYITVIPGQIIAITIGAGGAGSTNSSPGAGGGTTSVGSFLNLSGGAGGNSVTTSGGTATGGAGGGGTGGSFILAGNQGQGSSPQINTGFGGNGASAPFGGQGGLTQPGSYNGSSPGGGGSGAQALSSGGTGGIGLVCLGWLNP